MAGSFIYKIKNRENKFFDFLYRIAKWLIHFNIPCVKPIYKILWIERKVRVAVWRWGLRVFYYTPLFKSVCYKVSKNLNLIDGLPYTNGNLSIRIGANVRIYGSAGFQGYKVYEKPILDIGDGTFIGPDVRIGVGKEITIGRNCLIAARVYISDHDGHPLDSEDRRAGMPVAKQDIKPIILEDDVWLGEGVFICKGVRIGAGAVVAARSVVTKDVATLTIVAGNPAKLIKEL